MSVAPLDPPSGGWSAEAYDALPADGYRRELIDGVLHVAPSPASWHQRASFMIARALDHSVPDGYVVLEGVEVKLADRVRYIPDVLVVTAEAYGDGNRSRYLPHEVALAVEIVSDSSRGMDRILKPSHYASAGIPCYWRVEREDELTVYAYRLGVHGDYVPTGDHRGMLKTTTPWAMSIDLSRIDR
jgi:Uma2 family endonuclease